MGYRRLPTTDKARYLALERMSFILDKDDLGVLVNKKKELTTLLEEFGNLLEKRKHLAELKKELNIKKNNLCSRLRLFISHYFQVINFSIERGDIDKMDRKFYGLEINMGNVPDLFAKEQLIGWANKIKQGEQKRVESGQQPISHPKVEKIEEIKNQLINQQTKLLKIDDEVVKNKIQIIKSRTKIDQFIKQTWNEIEARYSNETITLKQQKAARYGVVYVN